MRFRHISVARRIEIMGAKAGLNPDEIWKMSLVEFAYRIEVAHGRSAPDKEKTP